MTEDWKSACDRAAVRENSWNVSDHGAGHVRRFDRERAAMTALVMVVAFLAAGLFWLAMQIRSVPWHP
jgi:hypothetical protein